MTIETILIIALAAVAITATFHFRQEFVVTEGFAGLLYQNGKLRETLAAGRHVRWGRHFRLTILETRKTLLQVPGQDILTADKISVKVSTVLTIQITDPAKSVQTADSHIAHIYSAAQTAIRSVVASSPFETLLTGRVEISARARELIAPQAEAFGVQLHAMEIRDVMLPAELRKSFAEVLKVKQEGMAALERARAETATLRNLANAARMLEAQPALTTIRLMQTLEASGQTVILNDLSVLALGLANRGGKTS